MCPLSLSALTYTKADSLKVVQLLDAGKKQTRGTDLTLFFAEQFIGVPYVASTLEVIRMKNWSSTYVSWTVRRWSRMWWL